VWVTEPPPAALVHDLAGALPGSHAIPVRVAVGPWQLSPRADTGADGPDGPDSESVAVVADGSVLDAFQVSAGARAQLAEHGIVLMRSGAGKVEVHLPSGRSWAARSVASLYGPEGVSTVLVSPSTARAAGVEVRNAAVAVRSPHPLTDEQRDALTELVYGQGIGQTDIQWYTPSSGPSPFQLQLALSALALVFSVLVIAASLALAAAESRDERSALTLAGAPPRVLARTAGAKAGLLAVLGGLLAVPIGFLPVVVFSLVDETGLPVRLPWTTIGALVAAVPVVAGLIAWTTSGAASRLRPPRISAMAFD
jgi:hypothetical protein